MKISIFLTLFFVAFATAKVFTECEVGKALLSAGVSRTAIPRVICYAKKVSGLESSTQSEADEDGDRKHGIFHFNDRAWCKNGDKSSGNSCAMTCDSLRDDDIANDAECVARMEDRNEFSTFEGYQDCLSAPQTIVGVGCIL